MKIKRHLIYRCEIAGGQKYTKREVSSGCGCWTVHSTTRMTTPTYKEDQIRPWIAVCPKCGKKSRMRTRDEPKNCFATREEAVFEMIDRNIAEGNTREVIEKNKDVSKDARTPKIMPMSDYLALTHDSIVINLRKDDPKTPLIMSIIQSVLHLGEWEG
jgi:hypothetical protein